MRIAIAVVAAVMLAAAVPRPEVSPPERNGGTARRTVDAAAVDAVMRENGFVRGGLSGASVAIAVDGRVAFARGFGERDAGAPDRWQPATEDFYRTGHGLPAARRSALATPRTIYAAGSISKTVVAAAIHALAQDRALSVDDPVARWFPEFGGRRELTLRNLLEQTSGLPDYNDPEHLRRFHGKPRDALIEFIAHERPDFAPGERYAYSNTNYMLLGRVVELASERPLQRFLAERFFTPLEMTRTSFGAFASNADVAVGYSKDEQGRVRAYPWDFRWLGGAGSLTTDALDLARFDAALIDGRVIGRDQFKAMSTPSGAHHGLGTGAYAHGLVVDRISNHPELWHNGEIGGFHAVHALFPEDRIAIVVLTNQQQSHPETLIGPLLAAVVPLNPIEQIFTKSEAEAMAVMLGGASLASIAVVAAAIWRRRRWWVCILVALAALVFGAMMPAFAPLPLAFALALVPAALLAVPWRRAMPKPNAGRGQ